LAYAQSGWETHRPETQVCLQVDTAQCLALIELTLQSDWLRTPLVS
jgi:hypothetical protein